MANLDEIKHHLEKERELLNKLVGVYGILHPLVLKQSKLLDEIINTFNSEHSGSVSSREARKV